MAMRPDGNRPGAISTQYRQRLAGERERAPEGR
jgi:hypothetical protein